MSIQRNSWYNRRGDAAVAKSTKKRKLVHPAARIVARQLIETSLRGLPDDMLPHCRGKYVHPDHGGAQVDAKQMLDFLIEECGEVVRGLRRHWVADEKTPKAEFLRLKPLVEREHRRRCSTCKNLKRKKDVTHVCAGLFDEMMGHEARTITGRL